MLRKRNFSNLVIILLLYSLSTIFSSFLFHNNPQAITFIPKSKKFSFPYKEQYLNSSFLIKVNGAIANHTLAAFCHDHKCSIPAFFDGIQNINIVKNGKVIDSFVYNGDGYFRCSKGKKYIDRICTFKNSTYFLYTFYFDAPYNVTFDETIALAHTNSRTSLYGRIKASPNKLFESIGFIDGEYFLVTKDVLPKNPWHKMIEMALPIFQTIYNEFGYPNNVSILTLYDSLDDIPQMVNMFTNGIKNEIASGYTYEKIVVGQVKIEDFVPHSSNTSVIVYGVEYFNFSQIRNFRLFQREIWRNYKIEIEEPSKIVLIRRRKRIITNEAEFMGELRKVSKDFETVFLEDLSEEEIIKLMYKTKVLIGVHGAGLANLIFMQPHTSVVELFPHNTECRDWYESLSAMGGLRHFWWSDPSGNESIKCPTHTCTPICIGFELKYQNVTVNIKEVMELVRKAYFSRTI